MSDKVATGTAYAASATTVFASALNFNELLGLAGVIIAAATFLYNVWVKERIIKNDLEYKRAMLEELHNKKVVSIAQDVNTVVKE